MRERDQDSGFEKFRRERLGRRLNSGEPRRDLGNQANILRELEKADAAEIQDERLTREVAEFFEEATRTAAAIVARVAETQEQAATERISEEMHDFLVDAIQRMGMFVDAVKESGGADGEKVLETHMQNLVGPMLDSFRMEGTAQLQDQHIGQDPFDTEVDQLAVARVDDSPSSPVPAPGHPDPQPGSSGSDEEPQIEKIRSVSDHGDVPHYPLEHELVPEKVIDAPADDEGDQDYTLQDVPPREEVEPEVAAPVAPPAAHPLLEGMMGDETKLKGALRLLVSGGLMSKEEARAIFRSRPKA